MEKIKTLVYEDAAAGSKYVAGKIRELIEANNKLGKKTVLGLATGSSPLKLYAELIRMHKEESLSFANVVTFNLDEYFPMQPNAEQSYVKFMFENLFNHIDIKKENVNIPDGTLAEADVAAFCNAYEAKIDAAGGLDLQVLGIGRTGHIGFNEPGSVENSITRMVVLNDITRTDAANDFGGKEHVCTKAITMGVGTILKAKQIYLFAWGEKKASIVAESINGAITDQVPATFLQKHNNTVFILDKAASVVTA